MPKPSKVEIQHISPQGHSTECTHCTNVYKCPKCTIHCQTRIVTIITTNTDNVCGSCWVRELTEARSAKVGFGGSGGWRGEFGTIWRISIFTPLVGWSLSGTRHSWSVHPGPGWQNIQERNNHWKRLHSSPEIISEWVPRWFNTITQITHWWLHCIFTHLVRIAEHFLNIHLTHLWAHWVEYRTL